MSFHAVTYIIRNWWAELYKYHCCGCFSWLWSYHWRHDALATGEVFCPDVASELIPLSASVSLKYLSRKLPLWLLHKAAILCFYGYWHSHTPLLPQQLGLFPTVQLLPSRRQLHFPVQQCGLDVGQTLWLDPRKATTPKCTIKLYEAQPSLFAFWIRAHGINWLTSHPSSAHCKFKAFSQTLSSGFRDLAQIVQACACWCLWR